MGQADQPIRVVIVDDQEMVRAGFGALLDAQPDIEVVDNAENGASGIEVVARCAPDIVLMDIRMPVLDGIAATRQITATDPAGPRIVILTTFDLDDYVFDALHAGASGFLLKDSRAEDLIHAVRVVAGGEALLAPSVTRSLIAEYVAQPQRPRLDIRIDELTDREREIMIMVARGLTNAEIAGQLFLSGQTVKTHVSRILAKLQLRDRAQIVVAAYESGLVAAGG